MYSFLETIYAGYEGRDKIEYKDIIKVCIRVLFKIPDSRVQESNKYIESIAVHDAGDSSLGL